LKISALPGLSATGIATDGTRFACASFAVRLGEASGNRSETSLLALNRCEC